MPDQAAATARLVVAADRQFDEVRRALAERREALGISRSELARRVGVSPSLVSQIERGQTLPSVATLFALAAALGATVDAFFDAGAGPDGRASHADGADDPADDGASAGAEGRTPAAPRPARTPNEERYVVRADERAQLHIQGGVRWERLTPTPHQDVEFLELVYEPHAESDAHLYRHPGIETLLVLEGMFRIDIGFESYDLGPGDSMVFPSSLPHRYVNPLPTESRAVSLILRDPLGDPGGAAPTSHPR